MKRFLLLALTLFTQLTFAADVKISQLPLGTASGTGVNDSFPYVSAAANITRRLTLWDLINLPPMVLTYAPKANPTFTGTVTAPTFVGALTGNATTASSLANNPTDCSSDTYATAIAANGNLTCGAISNASTTGTSSNTASTLVLRNGSGNFSAGTITASLTGTASGNTTYTPNQYGVVVSGAANSMTVIAPDASTSKVLKSGGASADPSWLAYTNANTASTIVARDGSGNFSAGTITAALTGTASGNTAYTPNQYGLVASGSANTMSVIAPDSSTTKWLKSGGASANPAWASFTSPTQQRFTSGSAQTYTTPAGVLYIRVRLCGGGGGGGGSTNSSNNAGTGGNGGATSFGTSLLSANAGSGGGANSNYGGAGGTASISSPAYGTAISGGYGMGAGNHTAVAVNLPGGMGASSPWGGAGGGGTPSGVNAVANSCSGGGGAESPSSGNSGSGGGAGGYVDAIIPGPSSTYTYTVGGGGSAGSAGSSGQVGGTGGAGYIEVTEYYQ